MKAANRKALRRGVKRVRTPEELAVSLSTWQGGVLHIRSGSA
jgi:hypothetical protein